MLLKVTDNILKDPYDVKKRRLRLKNRVVEAKLVRRNGAPQCLAAIGFQRIAGNDEDPTIELDMKRGEHDALRSRLVRARALFVAEAKQLGVDRVSTTAPRPEASVLPPSDEERAALVSDAFKSRIVRLVPQPRSATMSETERELKKLKEKETRMAKEESRRTKIGCGNRRLVVLRAGDEAFSASSSSPSRVHSANDHNTTHDRNEDARLVRMMSKQRREKIEKQKRFTTRAMRELEAQKRKRVCTEIVLRVHMPCRSVVQARFRPSETVGDVVNEIRSWMPTYLRESAHFAVATSAPRMVISSKPSTTKLTSLRLGIAAHLYVSWIDDLLPTGKNAALCLSKELLAVAGNSRDCAEEDDLPKTFALVPEKPPPTSSSRNRNRSTTKKRSSGFKKPSWLKL